jgi:hypothetical protein
MVKVEWLLTVPVLPVIFRVTTECVDLISCLIFRRRSIIPGPYVFVVGNGVLGNRETDSPTCSLPYFFYR